MEKQLQKLREQRVNGITQVNSISNKIALAIKRHKPVDVLDSFLESLTEMMADLTSANTLYDALLNHDVEGNFSAYKLTAGKSVSEFLHSAQTVYDSTVTLIVDYEMSIKCQSATNLKQEIESLLYSNDFMLGQLDGISSNSASQSQAAVVFGEVDIFLNKLRNSVRSLKAADASGDNSDLFSSVDKCITNLEHKVVVSKQMPHLLASQKQAVTPQANQHQTKAVNKLVENIITSPQTHQSSAFNPSTSGLSGDNSNTLTSPSDSVNVTSANSMLLTTDTSVSVTDTGVSASLSDTQTQIGASAPSTIQVSSLSTPVMTDTSVSVTDTGVSASLSDTQTQIGASAPSTIQVSSLSTPVMTDTSVSVTDTSVSASLSNTQMLPGACAPSTSQVRQNMKADRVVFSSRTPSPLVNSGLATIPEAQDVSSFRLTNRNSRYLTSTPLNSESQVRPLNLSITAAYDSSLRTGTGIVSNNTSTRRENSRFQKAPLPTFGGNRREWAEFRAVWLSYAYHEIDSEEERAWALKQCLKGEALSHVRAILANQPNAHERMWKRLEDLYSDASVAVKSTFLELERLKQLTEGDNKGLVSFVNTIELCYSQLGEVRQLLAVTPTQVDVLRSKLPPIIRREWMRVYSTLPTEEKIHPFTSFMKFLESERDFCIRELSEDVLKSTKHPEKDKKASAVRTHAASTADAPNRQTSSCLVHTNPKVIHNTMECRQFRKMGRKERVGLLIKHKACFRCAGLHKRENCKSTDKCSICRKEDHHTLLCKGNGGDGQGAKCPKPSSDHQAPQTQDDKTTNHAKRDMTDSVFPIQLVPVAGSTHKAVVFSDGGSNATYVATSSVRKLNGKKMGTTLLRITRVGNTTSEQRANVYRIRLVTTTGKVVPVIAYGMEEITTEVPGLDIDVLKTLFPHRNDLSDLVRQRCRVDILLGNDYYGFHPKVEIDTAGTHLSLMSGAFGRCLQGSHPSLKQGVMSNLIGSSCTEEDEKSSVDSFLTKADIKKVEMFIEAEEMATEVHPRCGGCKCGKCPIRGHDFSFQEQQELELIRNNLSYDSQQKVWVTAYPWIKEPSTLPDNYNAVFATMRSTEQNLRKRGEQWVKVYQEQIEDMICRDVARKLTADEIEKWAGPKFYISHLAVENQKSLSTPVRIVFNSSQKFQGQSLNDALAKGPDCYLTNLMGILLRWREKPAVMIGDVRKMFNSIKITKEEQHCHRFLWRDMDANRDPEIYVITRVNMGDRPAPAISAEAILKTGELMKDKYPRVNQLFQQSMYVDDIVESVDSEAEAKSLADDATQVLKEGGFNIKGWVFKGNGENMETTHVLGVEWSQSQDEIRFTPRLNFSTKRRGKHSGPDIRPKDIPVTLEPPLTKRIVLCQIMRLYDPLGILSPFIIVGKIYLRETWDLGLGWDDPLPPRMKQKWVEFLLQMGDLEQMKYDRCLMPLKAKGKPTLIILCDASDKAYGFAAYVRWKLEDNSYFCRLILAKSRIAPLKKLSTPQLELNGAVLAKRGRETILKEMRYNFDKVVHLTDSETVLCMLAKTSTRFKLYEGVRVGEVQAGTNSDEWKWVDGNSNTADWVSRGCKPCEIGPKTEWWRGPSFLYLAEGEWPTKTVADVGQKGPLPGEKSVSTHHSRATKAPTLDLNYGRFGSAKKLIWTVARLVAMAEAKSFKAGRTSNITPRHIEQSKKLLIKDVQLTMTDELTKSKRGRYARLKPTKDSEGIWVIGERMVESNPLKHTPTDPPQRLLPSMHPLSRLLMEESHRQGGHRGRDATLARFRHDYWVPQGTSLAKWVKNSCRMCRIREPKLLSQQMGCLPLGKLQQSAPFTNTVLDLFGPFPIRGEVQKRSTGKAWGVIFMDLYSRAVHIEPVFSYDTSSFLMALRRFTNIRGWPKVLYSDPGSQLTHADKELKSIWRNIDRDALYKAGTDSGMEWIFGPADAPWYQGGAEALIKSIKKCLRFCMSGQRLSAAEFLTVCTEAANVMNERPLGRIPSDDGEINMLTPNSLLLGRCFSNSLGHATQLADSSSMRADLVEQVSDRFWKHWLQLLAPTMAVHTKWLKNQRNLQVGDIVLVSDSNALRSQYHLAEVIKTYPDKKGLVRRADLRYRSYSTGSCMLKRDSKGSGALSNAPIVTKMSNQDVRLGAIISKTDIGQYQINRDFGTSFDKP
ncbi:uncharacterized protein [Watersipora subatra]|uniref:uncharacterized protein n=1 Tax=Watersipora subatra TaxID=2589382 RepID=UPI00355B363F